MSWPLTPRFSCLSPFVLFRIYPLAGGSAVVDLLDLVGPAAPDRPVHYCLQCSSPVVVEGDESAPHYTPQRPDAPPFVCRAVLFGTDDNVPGYDQVHCGACGRVWFAGGRVRPSGGRLLFCPGCWGEQ